jgi:hypothetical protein
VPCTRPFLVPCAPVQVRNNHSSQKLISTLKKMILRPLIHKHIVKQVRILRLIKPFRLFRILRLIRNQKLLVIFDYIESLLKLPPFAFKMVRLPQRSTLIPKPQTLNPKLRRVAPEAAPLRIQDGSALGSPFAFKTVRLPQCSSSLSSTFAHALNPISLNPKP